MGTASASGAKRTIEAAQRAIASPLLEAGAIDGARGILINITGSSLAEVGRSAAGLLRSFRTPRTKTPTSSSARCSTRR